MVTFPYDVEVGSHDGRRFTLGISMQGEEPYPEYPPHWIHIHPPVNDQKGGAVNGYEDAAGRHWVAMSRPPGSLWDELPTKTMALYVREHLRRLWKDM